MKIRYVVSLFLVTFVALRFDQRLYWKDALLLIAMSPMAMIQPMLPPLYPIVEKVREEHNSGGSSQAMATFRTQVNALNTLSWYLSSNEVQEFAASANTTHFTIPSTHDVNVEIPVLLIQANRATAKRESKPLVIMFHGGGMASGTHHIIIAYELAMKCDASVISVDYRLAPEYPFPAGVNDAYDALLWAQANGGSIGIDPKRIGVAGVSGGGLMAAAVSHRARDSKLKPPIVGQYLDIPVLRYAGQGTASWTEFFYIPGLNANVMGWFWEAYTTPLGCTSNLCSPLHDTDFGNLPTTILVAAFADVLRDDAVLYKEMLSKANVEVKLFIKPTSHMGAAIFRLEEDKEAMQLFKPLLHG